MLQYSKVQWSVASAVEFSTFNINIVFMLTPTTILVQYSMVWSGSQYHVRTAKQQMGSHSHTVNCMVGVKKVPFTVRTTGRVFLFRSRLISMWLLFLSVFNPTRIAVTSAGRLATVQ